MTLDRLNNDHLNDWQSLYVYIYILPPNWGVERLEDDSDEDEDDNDDDDDDDDDNNEEDDEDVAAAKPRLGRTSGDPLESEKA